MKFMQLMRSVGSYDRFLQGEKTFEELYRNTSPMIRERMLPLYRTYTQEVSSSDMAVSLELGIFLYALCQAKGYKRLVDFGSGFSSCVFRLYARETPGVEVFSVDDDEQWLEKTRQFLVAHDLDTHSLMSMDLFFTEDRSGFDCILCDLNLVGERIKHVERLLTLVRPGGYIFFDDVHKPDYLYNLLNILSRSPGSYYSLKPATLDSFGRFSLAYQRPT